MIRMRFGGGEQAVARRRRNYNTIVVVRLEAGRVVLGATQIDLQLVLVLVVVVLARRFDQSHAVALSFRRSVLNLRSGRPTRGGHFPAPRPDLVFVICLCVGDQGCDLRTPK